MNTLDPRSRALLIGAGVAAGLGFVLLLAGVIGEWSSAFQGGVVAYIVAIALAWAAHVASNRTP